MGVAGGGIGMISLYLRYGEVSMHPPIYNPNKTCLAYIHTVPRVQKKIKAWCKWFYIEDYGRRKKKWLGQGLNPLPLAW